jgi:hypothetical protein
MTQSLAGYGITSNVPGYSPAPLQVTTGLSDENSANVSNPSGEFMPQYGGYAGGFQGTIGLEQQLGQQAATQKAAQANFAPANALLGQASGVGGQQGALARSMGGTANAWNAIGQGHGLSAADYGIGGQQGGAIAAAQAAGAANPLAARAAQANLGNTMGGIAGAYGGDIAGSMQSAQAAAISGYGAQAAQYGQQGQGAIAEGQQYGQNAGFNASMQEKQNAIDAQTALQYRNALLGVQQTEGGAMNQAQSAWDQYQVAQGQHSAQVSNQAIGAATSAAGAAAAAL